MIYSQCLQGSLLSNLPEGKSIEFYHLPAKRCHSWWPQLWGWERASQPSWHGLGERVYVGVHLSVSAWVASLWWALSHPVTVRGREPKHTETCRQYTQDLPLYSSFFFKDVCFSFQLPNFITPILLRLGKQIKKQLGLNILFSQFSASTTQI